MELRYELIESMHVAKRRKKPQQLSTLCVHTHITTVMIVTTFTFILFFLKRSPTSATSNDRLIEDEKPPPQVQVCSGKEGREGGREPPRCPHLFKQYNYSSICSTIIVMIQLSDIQANQTLLSRQKEVGGDSLFRCSSPKFLLAGQGLARQTSCLDALLKSSIAMILSALSPSNNNFSSNILLFRSYQILYASS